MAKTKTRFTCQKCGHETPRWIGRCPDCGEWNSFLEEVVPDRPAASLGVGLSTPGSTPVPIASVPMEAWKRIAQRQTAAGVEFVIEPTVRFAGQAGEQATMFLFDPAGNALEFKAMADPAKLFAKD